MSHLVPLSQMDFAMQRLDHVEEVRLESWLFRGYFLESIDA